MARIDVSTSTVEIRNSNADTQSQKMMSRLSKRVTLSNESMVSMVD